MAHDEVCPHCHARNAHAWQDANMDPHTHERDPDCLDETADVWHIPTASGFEWQCGRCLNSWTAVDSPLNHPCYTHRDD